jgi:hypothetical protein
MVQELTTKPSIFGRLGMGLSRGLAETVPKEIERQRLSQGLKKFGEGSKDRSPMENLIELASIPGAAERPQLIQSFGQLAQQEGRNQANLRAASQNQPRQIEKIGSSAIANKQEEGITTREPTEATLKPYIPRGYQERHDAAAENYNIDPARYDNKFENALKEEMLKDQSALEQNTALQGQRGNERLVKDDIEKELETKRNLLGAKIPGNVYDDVRTKALNAVKPVELGGEGLTEEQATAKYGKDLDKISRQYQEIKNLGAGHMLFDDPKTNRKIIDTLSESFRERGDEENFAQELITNQQISPEAAYYFASPVSKNKELNNAIIKAPDISKNIPGFSQKELMKQNPDMSFKQIDDVIAEKRKEYTYRAAKALAPKLGKNGSPLAVGMELQARGYDPEVWYDYLDKNRKELGLYPNQIDQLSKRTSNWFPSLKDKWFFYNSGLDKLAEIK